MSIPFKSDAIIVTSGGPSDPRIVAGTGDPTAGVAASEGSIYLRYVLSSGQVYVKTGTGDTNWTALLTSGGGTLDQAYDFGGLGAGRAIAADSGAVEIDGTTADTQAALIVNRSPISPAASVGINLTIGSNVNASGIGLSISDAGAGDSIQIEKSGAGAAIQADLTNVGAQALIVNVNAAPTSVSPIAVVANTTGTTAALVSLSKIPVGSTAGAALSVSMGANTTGPGITVSQAGTGAAIQVSSGAIEIANSSPGVSPANSGRIKYNSTTQTFQMSLNGGAYEDIAGSAGVGSISIVSGTQDDVDVSTEGNIDWYAMTTFENPGAGTIGGFSKNTGGWIQNGFRWSYAGFSYSSDGPSIGSALTCDATDTANSSTVSAVTTKGRLYTTAGGPTTGVGFRFAVPADSNTRYLRVRFCHWSSVMDVRAHFLDGSVADAAFTSDSGASTNAILKATVTYKSAYPTWLIFTVLMTSRYTTDPNIVFGSATLASV